MIPRGCIGCRNCGYVGTPRVVNLGGEGPSGCLAIALLCFGIIPGVLYLLFGGGSDNGYACCPRCNAPYGPWALRPGWGTWLIVVGLLGFAVACWVGVR